ncbi:signal peptidase complex subunit 1 [Crotalus tigris]|uniref:signal peptidase complex subunit 1 n=1 Tax=Crotalus tigris TaxID=88082 RepID=UPI00192F3E6F|nr:signal peptidase complex subunit 1 [Crotalus tigris]
MMRRGKRTSNPVCSRAPALRQKAVLIKKPEAPVDCSSLGCPASNDNPQDDSFQPPESKLPPCRAEELPLPPFLSESADGCRDLGAAAPPGTMLNFFRSIPTQMDYKGQKLAEQIFQGIILFSAVVGFIYGYITEQFGWTVYIVMAGFAISCLLTLPPWPIYRRNPLKWLPVQESAIDDKKPADRKVKRHPKN